MANITDKITDTRNAARPNSTTVSSARSSGGTTLACSNLTGWSTASKVHFVTYQIDSNSNPIAGTQLDCYGIVSGNNIGSFTVVDGTDNGNSIGDVVEMLPTAAWGQDLADALTSTHNRSGGLLSGINLTAPTIADFTNSVHDHIDNEGGGTLGFSALVATIFSGQVQTQANAGGGLGTLYWINLGGIKLMWGISTAQTVNTNKDFVFTLPAFFTTVQTCFSSPAYSSGSNVAYCFTQAFSTSSIDVQVQSTASVAYQAQFFMIGT